jgi:predicted molibdopterin-dependent oxidoreductase YjgC
MPEPTDLRVDPPAGSERGRSFTFRFDGRPYTAYPGETIAAALLAAGVRELRATRFQASARGLLCGIGSCYDCLVTVDGRPGQRACLTPATPDAEVEPHDVADLV